MTEINDNDIIKSEFSKLERVLASKLAKDRAKLLEIAKKNEERRLENEAKALEKAKKEEEKRLENEAKALEKAKKEEARKIKEAAEEVLRQERKARIEKNLRIRESQALRAEENRARRNAKIAAREAKAVSVVVAKNDEVMRLKSKRVEIIDDEERDENESYIMENFVRLTIDKSFYDIKTGIEYDREQMSDYLLNSIQPDKENPLNHYIKHNFIKTINRVISDFSYPEGFVYFKSGANDDADDIDSGFIYNSPKNRKAFIRRYNSLAKPNIPNIKKLADNKKHTRFVEIDDSFYPIDGWYYNTGVALTVRPLDVVVRKEEVSIVLDFIRFLCNDNEEYYNYLLGWLSFKLQNPGAKAACNTVFIGSENKGIGKSFLGEHIIKSLFGKFCSNTTLSKAREERSLVFNNKLFLIMNEIEETGGDNLKDFNAAIKRLLADTEITVNPKFKDTRPIKQVCNFFLTSNKHCLNIKEIGDRRIFYLWCEQPAKPREYYTNLHNFVHNKLNARKLFTYLYNFDWEESGFHPNGDGLETSFVGNNTTENEGMLVSYIRRLFCGEFDFSGEQYVANIGTGKTRFKFDSRHGVIELNRLCSILRSEVPNIKISNSRIVEEVKKAGGMVTNMYEMQGYYDDENRKMQSRIVFFDPIIDGEKGNNDKTKSDVDENDYMSNKRLLEIKTEFKNLSSSDKNVVAAANIRMPDHIRTFMFKLKKSLKELSADTTEKAWGDKLYSLGR